MHLQILCVSHIEIKYNPSLDLKVFNLNFFLFWLFVRIESMIALDVIP